MALQGVIRNYSSRIYSNIVLYNIYNTLFLYTVYCYDIVEFINRV